MAANRPLPSPLPADLPEDWQDNQIVAPEGADVGLTEQHGYNYLMQQVNDAQRAANQLKENQGTVDENLQQLQESLEKIQTALNGKQDELSGTKGQVVGFDEEGHAVAQNAPSGGVSSFNGRTGVVTPQAGDYRVSQVTGAAPTENPVFTGSISLGRKTGSGIRTGSFACGNTVEASGYNSHAEGNLTTASGFGSHAEGVQTTASADQSHAEGIQTTASGNSSRAGGWKSHSSGYYSFTQGTACTATKTNSCAFGDNTESQAISQFVIGSGNVRSSASENKFIVGKGSNYGVSPVRYANCFRVTDTGVYATGSYSGSGADYAELFEWKDQNKSHEDRAGLFVTLEGEQIRIAGPEDDYILGIVSGNPSVIGDVYDDQWQGMFLKDIFGRAIWEDVKIPAVLDAKGNIVVPEYTSHREKVNSDYNPTETYVPRTKRPEWDAVGLLGKLVAVDDGTCQVNGWATVGVGGVATASPERTKYRIMARLDDTHVKVMIL